MRFTKFSTTMLALIFSILLEALYFAAFKVFGTTAYGNMTNF
jgi:hypothetical protein